MTGQGKGQRSAVEALAYILIVLLCCAGGMAVQAAAPCWLFSLTPTAEVPARCIGSFVE